MGDARLQTRTHTTERSGLAGRARRRPAPADRVGAHCRMGSPRSFSSGGRGPIRVRGSGGSGPLDPGGDMLVPAGAGGALAPMRGGQRALRHARMRVRPSASVNSNAKPLGSDTWQAAHRLVDLDRRLGAAACGDQRAAAIGQPEAARRPGALRGSDSRSPAKGHWSRRTAEGYVNATGKEGRRRARVPVSSSGRPPPYYPGGPGAAHPIAPPDGTRYSPRRCPGRRAASLTP